MPSFKRFILVATFILFLVVPSSAYSAQKVKEDDRCNKVGSEKVIKSKKLICVFSGSKTIWKKVKDSKMLLPLYPPYKVSQLNAQYLAKIENPTSRSLEEMLNLIQLKENVSQIKPIIFIEPGMNHTYPEILIDNMILSLKFYSSIGMTPDYNEIIYGIGRNQEWFDKNISENCKKSQNKVVSSVYIGKCSLGEKRVAIYTNLPYIFTQNIVVDSDIDLSSIKLDRNSLGYSCGSNCITYSSYLAAIYQAGHEIFHAHQDQTMDLFTIYPYKRFPQWFIEGSAETFGRLTLSKMNGVQESYGELTYKFFRHFGNGPESSSSCQMPFLDYIESFKEVMATPPFISNGCAYSFGSLGTDVLLVSLGSFEKFQDFLELMKTKDFEAALVETTGMTLETYSTKVDSYAKHFRYGPYATEHFKR